MVSNALADAEKEFRLLAESANPPPVRQDAEEDLARLYDKMSDRPRALLAARIADQMHEAHTSLAGRENDSTFPQMRSDLAGREEEAGQYAQAAIDYLAARNFSRKDAFESDLFDYDLGRGRARSLRKSGDPAGAATLCSHAHSRVFPLLPKLHLSPWWQWGGGMQLEQARWQFSCGDFDLGVQQLFQIANARIERPRANRDYSDQATTLFMMEPFDALESAFLYNRMSDAARQARAISSQVYAIYHGQWDVEPDQADTDSLRQETQQLMSAAGEAHPGKP
jgi:hypothetical protein